MGTEKKRDPLDRYYTPEWVIEQCLRHVLPNVLFAANMISGKVRILEPGAGDGGFIRGLRRLFAASHITAIDVDPAVGPWSEADESLEGNFLETDWGGQRFDLVIGNPPYARAEEFCRAALELSDVVVYILRVDFLCSAGRSAFFRERPPARVYLLPNRPTFYGPALLPPYTLESKEGQTGEYDYAWICWAPMYQTESTRLGWLPEVPVAVRKGR